MKKKAESVTDVYMEHPDRISSYFRAEILPLAIVTVSGILYNIGMIAGPYFEGQLAQCLFDIMNGRKIWNDMAILALVYLVVILFVQGARCIKRYYVRHFANNTARNMRHVLYNSLVYQSREQLEKESVGTLMTKAITDVDACVEGMRKVTTEVFDTGVVLVSYLAMLFYYDWRLALISSIFTPVAYVIAQMLKKRIYRYNAAYKASEGQLNNVTLDRITNAITYRVYGCEENRDEAYEQNLSDYEHKAVAASIWENVMRPIYNIISMTGVVFIIWIGAKNITGSGWTVWNIAAFTTFLSCFTKMATKASGAAKLFNAVQKAQVSWRRIRPFMQKQQTVDTKTKLDLKQSEPVTVSDLHFCYPGEEMVLKGISFSAKPGQIIGVTGPVASGKSTLGKAFLCEYPYCGSIRIGSHELSEMTAFERSQKISYLGHAPELMSDSIEENIKLGDDDDVWPVLKNVHLDAEIDQMPQGVRTYVGSGGVRLSGGQQARLALARTLYRHRNLIILDDPFSAVDAATENEILQSIRSQAKDSIVVLISHRLFHFSEFDQVIWMQDGRAQVSNHETLLQQNEAYAAFYAAQMKGGVDLDEQS